MVRECGAVLFVARRERQARRNERVFDERRKEKMKRKLSKLNRVEEAATAFSNRIYSKLHC